MRVSTKADLAARKKSQLANLSWGQLRGVEPDHRPLIRALKSSHRTCQQTGEVSHQKRKTTAPGEAWITDHHDFDSSTFGHNPRASKTCPSITSPKKKRLPVAGRRLKFNLLALA